MWQMMHSSVQNEWYVKMFDQYLNRFLTKPFQFHPFEYFIIFGNRLTGLSSPLFFSSNETVIVLFELLQSLFWMAAASIGSDTIWMCKDKSQSKEYARLLLSILWTFQMLENVHCHLDFDIILIDILQAPNLRMYNLIISCYF